MEYLEEIVWYLSLPITIWISLKFVQYNINNFDKFQRKDNI